MTGTLLARDMARASLVTPASNHEHTFEVKGKSEQMFAPATAAVYPAR
jgi:hypothetical protein